MHVKLDIGIVMSKDISYSIIVEKIPELITQLRVGMVYATANDKYMCRLRGRVYADSLRFIIIEETINTIKCVIDPRAPGGVSHIERDVYDNKIIVGATFAYVTYDNGKDTCKYPEIVDVFQEQRSKIMCDNKVGYPLANSLIENP